MDAVILLGGLGTRIRSSIGDLPKALAPIEGRPFIEYQISLIKKLGIENVILCAGYQHSQIRDYVMRHDQFGVRVTISVEEEPLGTAGALVNARSLLGEQFMVFNGDTFFGGELSGFIQDHEKSRTLATIALIEVPETSRYGEVTLQDNGLVVQFSEKKQQGPGKINAGFYLFKKEVFDYFPSKFPLSIEKEVFPELARLGLMRGCLLHGYHIDIGTPKSYQQFQDDLKHLEQLRE